MPENHQVKPERKKIICDCGQPNYHILLPDGRHYDFKAHGNNSLSSDKCFNCHAILNMSSADDYAGIVQKYPFAATAHDDCVSDPAEVKQEQIDAIRSQIPDWSPDKPQWAMVRAILLNVFHIPLADSKELHFDNIAAFFQADTARNESDAEKSEIPEQNATVAKQVKDSSTINIQNSNVIMGNIQQPGNLQVGDYASIHKHPKIKKKGILRKIPRWIYYILGTLAALVGILHHFGWLEPIRRLFSR
jgi:hypothetical protein